MYRILDTWSLVLDIWDRADRERFTSSNSLYFREVTIAFVLYSIVDKTSFFNLQKWITMIHKNMHMPSFKNNRKSEENRHITFINTRKLIFEKAKQFKKSVFVAES